MSQPVPALPAEVVNLIVSFALAQGYRPDSPLPALRQTSRAYHRLVNASLYSHVEIAQSLAPLTAGTVEVDVISPAGVELSPKRRRRLIGGRYTVLRGPGGARLPGLDWNGGDGAREACIQRMVQYTRAIDYVHTDTLKTLTKHFFPLEHALPSLTTYRRKGRTPSGSMNNPLLGTVVTFLDCPSEPVYEGDDYAMMGEDSAADTAYLHNLEAGCDVLYADSLAPSVHTAVFNITFKTECVPPTAMWLGKCRGLAKVVFILDTFDCVSEHVWDYPLGVLAYLVTAVAKARTAMEVVFVLNDLGNEWLGKIELPVGAEERREALRAAIVAEIAAERAEDDTTPMSSVTVCSPESFRATQTPEFYDLCTLPCSSSLL
ncbi:uncharacterized protein LOC62_01G000035 [Vanrija pseudolonga]|uniref:Uncharacterized protein n=1 Tax=Vanrija pseudolonga TaxID=143232 RepID=A0AAF0Y1N7_9TREE|nr:hypothetical protein LOC62_01G000035 [Vanrija pseudolonga]